MRTKGSPAELEHRRQLAVERVLDGYTTQEVAEFLGADARSVRRWLKQFRHGGCAGLAARSVSGRPRKLSRTQEKIVRRWLADSPEDFGFATGLWSCRRLAQLMAQEFGVGLHPHYLSAWLRERGFTPQKPARVPRERDPQRIAAWLEKEWPRIKKKPAANQPTWLCLTRAAS
jgi:transposase